MITAEFYLENEVIIGFSVKGHAMFAEYGLDIVCASVTSAVELTANGITEILSCNAEVCVAENEVKLVLQNSKSSEAVNMLKALRLHLELLSQSYSNNLKIVDVEV